jgi:hypothetical protein
MIMTNPPTRWITLILLLQRQPNRKEEPGARKE